MEVRVYSCTECGRFIQCIDNDLGRRSDHRCPRHPFAPMTYHGNIYYTILMAGPPAGMNNG